MGNWPSSDRTYVHDYTSTPGNLDRQEVRHILSVAQRLVNESKEDARDLTHGPLPTNCECISVSSDPSILSEHVRGKFGNLVYSWYGNTSNTEASNYSADGDSYIETRETKFCLRVNNSAIRKGDQS